MKYGVCARIVNTRWEIWIAHLFYRRMFRGSVSSKHWGRRSSRRERVFFSRASLTLRRPDRTSPVASRFRPLVRRVYMARREGDGSLDRQSGAKLRTSPLYSRDQRTSATGRGGVSAPSEPTLWAPCAVNAGPRARSRADPFQRCQHWGPARASATPPPSPRVASCWGYERADRHFGHRQHR